MNTDKLSRRRLLGGFLATLSGWLWPSSPHVRAAPRRPAWVPDPQPSQRMHSVTYSYDGMGRLTSVTEHPPCPIELPPHCCVHVTREQEGTFTYYG